MYAYEEVLEAWKDIRAVFQSEVSTDFAKYSVNF